MATVNLFLAGFNKCGSSTMTLLLDRHPSVLLPKIYEPWHFNKPDYRDRAAAYEALYPRAADYPIVCDDSAGTYSSRPPNGEGVEVVAGRIHDYNPAARFLFVARDPVARIESGFREFHSTGVKFGLLAPFDLGEALQELPQLVADSCYYECISVYRDLFGADRLHLVYLEDLLDRPEETMAAVWEFLDVDPGAAAARPLPRANRGTDKIRDTRLLRRLRGTARVGPPLAKIPIEAQDRWLTKIGLRRKFRGSVEWSAQARAAVVERVWPDAQKLWVDYGAPRGGWPRLQALASG